MRYLTLGEVVEIHGRLLGQSGGSSGIRDLGLLQSALAQPQVSFGSQDLHPTLTDKAAALGLSIAGNHPFVDGNKRVAHAAIEAFLGLNGHAIEASVDEQEALMLSVAAGEVEREALAEWLRVHVKPIE